MDIFDKIVIPKLPDIIKGLFRNDVVYFPTEEAHGGKPVRNEMHPELAGLPGTNPLYPNVSAVRNQMYGNHQGQTLVLLNSEIRRFGSGMDDEYGKATYNVKMPCDAHIIKLINRYQSTIGDTFAHSPLTSVLYKDVSSKNEQYNLIHLPLFRSYHQSFGFEYQKMPGFYKLGPTANIAAGTVLLDSFNKKVGMLPKSHPDAEPEYFYQYGTGVNANIVYISDNGVAEDGFVISESFQKRLTFKTYQSFAIGWDASEIPLNTYGTLENPRIFPDIGEYLKPSGLLMALRKIRPDLTLCELDNYSLMQVQQGFDRTIYAGDGPTPSQLQTETVLGSRVIDIRVYYGGRKLTQAEIDGLYKQPIRYEKATQTYYREIVTAVNELRRERSRTTGRHEDIPMGTELLFQMTDAEAYLPQRGSTNDFLTRSQRPTLTYKKEPIRGWRVEFDIERIVMPNIGFKMTGTSGDKGVIVKILRDDEMGVDADGNCIEVYSCQNATINRMNPARLYGQAINAFSRDVGIEIRRILTGKRVGEGNGRFYGTSLGITPQNIMQFGEAKVNQALELLLLYYKVVSPVTMYKTMKETYPRDRLIHHLVEVVNNGIYIDRESKTPKRIVDTLIEMRALFPLTYGKVTFKRRHRQPDYMIRNGKANPVHPNAEIDFPHGRDGEAPKQYTGDVLTGPDLLNVDQVDFETYVSKEDILVGQEIIFLLEKTGEDNSAIASPKTNAMGIISKIHTSGAGNTSGEKYSFPIKLSGTRVNGEAEIRLEIATIGPHATFTIYNRNNDPKSHEALCRSLLVANTPSQIWQAVDHDLIKLGNGKPSQFRKHVSFVAGWTVEYKYQP